MKNLTALVAIFLLASSLILAQSEDKIIAKIGNISISGKEFAARYELTPLPGIHDKSIGEAMKEKLLYTLVAEKLLAQDALELGLDTNDIVKYTLQAFEKMFTRDALYKAEIKDKAQKKADSLLTAYTGSASEYWIIYIYSKEEKESNRIYALLQKGVPFDSVYNELKAERADTLKFKVGDLDEKIESELLKVKELSFSKPLFVNDGWYISKIVKKINPVLAQMTGWESEYKNLEKVAKQRAEAELYNNFMSAFFADKKIRANGTLLLSAAQKITVIFTEKSKNRKSDDEDLYLNITDLLKIENDFGKDSVNLPYVYLSDKTISLQNFLRWFRFESFLSKKYDFRSITRILNGKTKKFIEEELLAEEGFKRGLNKTAYAKESIDMWQGNYLYKIAYSHLFDSSGTAGDEVNILKEWTPQNTEIKIVEIYTDTLSVIEKVLNELRSNDNITELAKKYSKKKLSSEPVFRSADEYGETGLAAVRMQPGEVYGPMRTDEGYLLFKLLDKREKESTAPSVQSGKGMGSYQAVMKHVADLADKYSVTVNKESLKDINRVNINSLMFRNLGFGGRITAVPFVTPDNTWVKYWEEKKELNP